MKATIRTSLLAFALAGVSQAATVALVFSNTTVVTNGEVEQVTLLSAGQTLYVGIPYSAGAWPSAEATDFFDVTTFLLGIEGAATASFNFYAATETGAGLTGITALSGFTAGTADVIAADLEASISSQGAASQTIAEVQYADLVGNPFTSISNGIVWLGITNTSSNTIAYYSGAPGPNNSPSNAYIFASPFNSTQNQLVADSYTHTGAVFDSGNENVHPWATVTMTTIPVPEPGAAALGMLGGILLLRRRRIG